MNIIIAILLYLNLITSPGIYQKTNISAIIEGNRPAIEVVQNDPVKMDLVQREYLPKVEQIWIMDDADID